MSLAQIIITGLFTLLASLFTSAFWIEYYKRRTRKKDREDEDRLETSKEKIIDRRLMANELMERVRDLEKVERKLVEEKITDAKLISRLEHELIEARRFHIEQDEEIRIKRAEIERLNIEIRHIQSILQSIAKGEDIKEVVEAYRLMKREDKN